MMLFCGMKSTLELCNLPESPVIKIAERLLDLMSMGCG